MSESEAAGKLTRIPGIVDAEATTPVQSAGVPRLSEKGFKTGLLDIVELKIAKNPITQMTLNRLHVTFLSSLTITHPPPLLDKVILCLLNVSFAEKFCEV